jgi:hypothetical protein
MFPEGEQTRKLCFLNQETFATLSSPGHPRDDERQLQQ